MKYKLKEHVTDEMLIEIGYVITDNSYGQIGFEDCFEAIKKVDERYEVVLQNREKPLIVYVFDKEEDYYLNELYGDDVDVSTYITKEIELGYVEVVE